MSAKGQLDILSCGWLRFIYDLEPSILSADQPGGTIPPFFTTQRINEINMEKSGIIRTIESKDDAAVAALIRSALAEHDLALPGTVYFDTMLDHLSAFYNDPKTNCEYFVWIIDDRLVGCAGYYPFEEFDGCAELHKLYVDPEVRGQKLGYTLLKFVEEKARLAGYSSMYIETHTNLEKAIRLYHQNGYQDVPRPESVSHSAMNVFLKKDL